MPTITWTALDLGPEWKEYCNKSCNLFVHIALHLRKMFSLRSFAMFFSCIWVAGIIAY